MFLKNIYTSSSAFKASLYDINLTSFVNQSTIIRIELYKTFISDFFDKDSLTMKFMTTDTYNQFSTNDVLISLYDLCFVNLILWQRLHLLI